MLRMSFVGSMDVISTRRMVDTASGHVKAGGTRTASFIGRFIIVSLALRGSKIVTFGTVIGSAIGVI